MLLGQTIEIPDSLLSAWESIDDWQPRLDEMIYSAKTLRRDHYELASSILEHAIDIAREKGDSSWVGEATIQLGIGAYIQNNIPLSNEYYLEALRAIGKDSHLPMVARIYNNLGWNHQLQFSHKTAKEYYDLSLALCRSLNDSVMIGLALNNLGVLYKNQFKYDSSLVFLNQSLAYHRALGLEGKILFNLNNIGVIQLKKGQHESAIEYFLEALDLNIQRGDTIELINNWMNLSEANIALGNFQAAIDTLSMKLPIVQSLGRNNQYEHWINQLSAGYEGIGDYKSAMELQVQLKELLDSLYRIELTNSLHEIEARYNLSETNRQLSASQQANNRQRVAITLVAIALGVAIILIFGLIHFYRIKRRNEATLVGLNEEITRQSIRLKEANEEIKAMNMDLEDRVKLRTAVIEVQNEKLRSFAFVTHHRIRASLARILGLTKLLDMDGGIDEQRQFLGLLKESALELDETIHDLNDTLHEDVLSEKVDE